MPLSSAARKVSFASFSWYEAFDHLCWKASASMLDGVQNVHATTGKSMGSSYALPLQVKLTVSTGHDENGLLHVTVTCCLPLAPSSMVSLHSVVSIARPLSSDSTSALNFLRAAPLLLV